MKQCFPGTVVARNSKTAAEFLDGVFFATKGLMLAQVKEITGLDTPAIQNWANRGWMPKPVEKRYSVNHLARILIINMLRDVMKLENIATLLSYINGMTDDDSDNIILDSKLYCYICDILDRADFELILTNDALINLIEEVVSDYSEPTPGAHKKLVRGLQIILTYYASAVIKVRADEIFSNTVNN